MVKFNYKVRDKKGKEIIGSIDAPEETVVIKSLKQLNYSIISIEKQSQVKLNLGIFFSKFRKIKPQELLFFLRQLSTLLKAGMPLISSIQSILEQTKNKMMTATLDKISDDIKAGMNLSESFSRHPKVFSSYFVSMVRVGETGGILENILDRLMQLYSQELEIRTRIKSAITYPVILVIVTVCIVIFIVAGILPKFVDIFKAYDAKLPLATKVLLGISTSIRNFWYLSILVTIGILIWLKYYLKSKKGRYNFDIFSFKIPLFGGFYLKVTIAQFARTLAGLIRSGVPLLEALKVTGDTISNVTIKGIIEKVSERISKGESLSEPFKESGLFPVMVIQMISVGEKSGKLEQVLFDVADFYDQEINYAIRNMTAILEPMLLLVMGSIVAFIALSVLLPIFNLVKLLRH